jgi:AmiR/NasT family two-component response regulator
MDALISEFEGNIFSNNKETRVLLIGNYQTRGLKQSLELEGESLIIREAGNNTDMVAMVGTDMPDVIIVLTANFTPVEDFNHTLTTLCEIQMNMRTIIISENPFKYLNTAIKTKVAALLHRNIDALNLLPIIQEVCAWSHGQPIPAKTLSRDNQPGPETKSGGE